MPTTADVPFLFIATYKYPMPNIKSKLKLEKMKL